MTLPEMERRQWRTTRVLRNGNMEIPAGTDVVVTGKFKGLALEADPCPHCGVRIFISKVDPSGVVEVVA